MYLMSERFVKTAEHMSVGSVFSGIRHDELKKMPMGCPDKKTIDAFTKKIHDLLQMKHSIWKENQQLASLRDFLLPMLMNGLVKVT